MTSSSKESFGLLFAPQDLFADPIQALESKDMRKAALLIAALFLFTQPCCSQDSESPGQAKSQPTQKEDGDEENEEEEAQRYLPDWYLKDKLAEEAFSALGSARFTSPRGLVSARDFASTAARAKLFQVQNSLTKEIVKSWIAKCPKGERKALELLYQSPTFAKHLKDQPLFGSSILKVHVEKNKVYALAQSPAKIYFTKLNPSLEAFAKSQKKSVSKSSWKKLQEVLEPLRMAIETKQRLYLLRITKPKETAKKAPKKKD